MRHATFRRLLQTLALAATFALALVPTVGRVAQACQDAQAGDAWGAMCTVAGLEVAATAPMAHDAHAGHHMPMPAPAPMPHHGGGEDCPYCPLLQALVAPSVPMLLAPPAVPVDAIARRNPVDPTRFRHPNGLGSRGPPLHS